MELWGFESRQEFFSDKFSFMEDDGFGAPPSVGGASPATNMSTLRPFEEVEKERPGEEAVVLFYAPANLSEKELKEKF